MQANQNIAKGAFTLKMNAFACTIIATTITG